MRIDIKLIQQHLRDAGLMVLQDMTGPVYSNFGELFVVRTFSVEGNDEKQIAIGLGEIGSIFAFYKYEEETDMLSVGWVDFTELLNFAYPTV
jgi:hypothetical protein